MSITQYECCKYLPWKNFRSKASSGFSSSAVIISSENQVRSKRIAGGGGWWLMKVEAVTMIKSYRGPLHSLGQCQPSIHKCPQSNLRTPGCLSKWSTWTRRPPPWSAGSWCPRTETWASVQSPEGIKHKNSTNLKKKKKTVNFIIAVKISSEILQKKRNCVTVGAALDPDVDKHEKHSSFN